MIRQQAIICANADPDLCCHMASLVFLMMLKNGGKNDMEQNWLSNTPHNSTPQVPIHPPTPPPPHSKLTLAIPSSDIKTFRAARSRWTSLFSSRYAIPLHVSLKQYIDIVGYCQSHPEDYYSITKMLKKQIFKVRFTITEYHWHVQSTHENHFLMVSPWGLSYNQSCFQYKQIQGP